MVDFKVNYKEKDAPKVPELCKRLKKNYSNNKLLGIALTRDFIIRKI